MTTNVKPAAPLRAPLSGRADATRALGLSFCVLVVMLAVYQFSENTVDPDLWGHIVYGQEMLKTHGLERTEPYSWTALGQPWINHEILAEVCLGGVHALAGGSGVLLLKTVFGLLTFALCLRLGLAKLSGPARMVAWALAALAVVEISFGFAARPQIFTAFFLVVELWLLRKIHDESPLWAAGLPVLFIVWINTHGGVLAGIGLLGLAAGATTGQWLYAKFPARQPGNGRSPQPGTVAALWLGVVTAIAALFCNPWGAGLVRWLIGSVLWLRPQIAEWNPTPFGWDHASFFFLLALAAVVWICTQRPRAWWEVAACAAFAFLGWRATRNAPLCAAVILALLPPHLADLLCRFRPQLERLEALFHPSGVQKLIAGLLACAAVGAGIATFTLHKSHPLTMEVPGAQYPNGAVAFMREKNLGGKMLAFFDWGEMVIFHLPNCPPSIDGRLDTCYSREIIAQHWKFYNGEPYDEKILNPDAADFALLPANLAGAAELAQRPGWKPVYFDDTAVLLARDVIRYTNLAWIKLPVAGPKTAGTERVAFADRSARGK